MNRLPIQMPSGKIQYVRVKYERTKRRCFQCQRLTHDKSRCPLLANAPKSRMIESTQISVASVVPKQLVIGKDDPLYGILTEEQVGLDEVTKLPLIDPEVLDEMRQYVLVQDPAERRAREFRVKKQVTELLAKRQAQRIPPAQVHQEIRIPSNQHDGLLTQQVMPNHSDIRVFGLF